MKENSDSWINRAVVSLAGRDRGSICLVLQEEGEYLYLADGRVRPVERPKKKKRKHAQLLADACGEPIRFDGELFTNRFVRQWLHSVRETRLDKSTREPQVDIESVERLTTGRRSSSG